MNPNATLITYNQDTEISRIRVCVKHYYGDPYDCHIHFPIDDVHNGGQIQMGSNQSLVMDDDFEREYHDYDL